MLLPNDAELTDGRRSIITVTINADITDALDKINELSKAIESLSEKAKALNAELDLLSTCKRSAIVSKFTINIGEIRESVDIKQIMKALDDRISECAESRMVNE